LKAKMAIAQGQAGMSTGGGGGGGGGLVNGVKH